jgi:hypothetical protein
MTFRAYPVDAQWATRTRLSFTGRRALCAVLGQEIAT